ncbi:short chain dehydrogenase [Sphaerisporangium melleum]|uniref:Short chain dehydrogenase n=1 Tax=Sphaerisporangium melleum TaxID=321316 RepID=A0A917R3C4_9ACTN|nr:SDR family oxidoreductase [Sphaerisporangium melleum]GGK87774.1 short chain dehydrogenase [Sphaerisporangium melleum]GII72441.1 short chain dehydrogenase [Sphaerisporangium melleum]
MAEKSLSGALIVVVGGSSGIGKAVARQAASAGAKVVVASRSEEKLAQTAKEIDGVTTGVIDVTDEESVRAFFGTVGALDHLVVCPGDMATGSVYEMAADDVRRCIDTKIVGQMLCVRHAGRKISEGGSITLLAGAAGYKPYPDMCITAAANTAIGGLGRSLAVELAPIRVNVVVAGLIDTPLWEPIPEDARAALFEQTAKSSPVGRIGRPDDVATTVLHSMENTFVTGALLHVDGGAVL